MTADMPERYVIETTCPNCGHVAKSETSVEALSKARDWARNRSFEGVLPEIAATPSVCALERAGAARCTPELVEAETHWPTDGSGDEFDGGYDPTVERNPRLPGEKDTRPQADGKAINVRAAVEAVRPETDIDAWAEAEAALPDRWYFRVGSRGLDGYRAACYAVTVEADGLDDRFWGSGIGPTPTAALRNLTEKLTERHRATPLAGRPE